MRDSALIRIIRYTLFVCTIVVSFLSICAYINSRHSDTFQIFGFYGIFQPILIILSILLFIYWAIRLKVIAFIPFLTIALSWGFIGSVYQLPLKQKNINGTGKASFNLGTYNVQGFKIGNQRPSIVGVISDFMMEKKVDVLCLQEVDYDSTFTIDSIAKSFYYLPHYTYAISRKPGFHLMILSKFPIVRSTLFHFGQEGNQAMQADLVIEGDTVRVFNFHLQTTNFNQNKFEIVPENWLWNIHGEAEKSSTVYNVLHRNYEKRTVQAGFIRKQIDATTYPVIACGDMNSNPSSFTYYQLKGPLKDGFKTCGRGYEYTVMGLYRLYRVDYILHSKDFDGSSYQSYKLRYSDHKPVIMGITLK